MTESSAAVRRVRFSLAGAALVVGSLIILAGPVQAQATVSRFFGTNTDTFTASLEGCLPEGLVGTVTITETSTGQVVDTGTNVFLVHGLNVYDYHLDLPDGRYVQSWLNRDLYTFALTFVTNPPHSVYNVVTQDLRTIYAADGTPVGTLSIHAGFHITFTDLNGNDEPDPGEIATQFDYFHLRCG